MKTNKMFRLSVVLIASLWLSGAARGQEPVHEAEGMRVPASKETAEKKPVTPLSLRTTEAFQAGRNLHDLGDVTAELAAVKEKTKDRGGAPEPRRVAVVRTIAKTFGAAAFSKINAPLAVPADAPRQAWTMALRSPAALALRLHFVNFDVGGGSVIVYARRGDELVTLGPFTGKGPERSGDFWTALLPGDTAFIEVSGVAVPRLKISEVMHFDKDITGGPPGGNGQQEAAKAAELGCHLDVMCENVDSFARDATALLNYQVGSEGKVCTGTLINDRDNETVVPYLLTANHCQITAANVNSLMATFLFQRNACGGAVPTMLPSLTGGVVLEAEEDNDMKFIRLNGSVPAGVTLAGWSTGSPSNGSYGIHHPDGAFKRATFFNPSAYVLCSFTFDPDYWVMEARRGAIEGGSSGSGLFNPRGQLIGQLRGRCGPGTDDNGNCATDDGWRAVYGKFSVTYGRIQRWLEIGGTINVNRYYNGDELGTPAQPFRTVAAGNDLAWDNARLKIRTGEYNEAVTFTRRMSILADGGPVVIGYARPRAFPETLATTSAASYNGEVAGDAIAAAFGQGLASRIEAATSLPLPTTLAGVTVKVRDSGGVERAAPLFFVSPGQINYLVPAGTSAGLATVTTFNGGNAVAQGTTPIRAVAPALFTANASGRGVPAANVLRIRGDAQTFEPLARYDEEKKTFVPVPIDLGPEGDQVFLILYGTGFRARTALEAVLTNTGGEDAEVFFAGAAPGFAGLDQVNIRLPRSLAGKGEVSVLLTADNRAANAVTVNVR